MRIHNIVLTLGCVLAITVAGCSRQQSDWQKARETNTADAYEQFLKKYPTGEFTAQAEARVKELYEERDWQKARDADTQEA
jgi:outer membrane protein assembly factor BamD (BamD/ComL family)